MNRMFNLSTRFSKRIRNSIMYSLSVEGFISAVFAILGLSLKSVGIENIEVRILIVIISYLIIFGIIYIFIGVIYKNSIRFSIHQTPISVCHGDIFDCSGWKVIGCDTQFSTVVDDVVISKKSLQGQLISQHGDKEEIEDAINTEAQKKKLQKNDEGFYDFPLGTIIRYKSSVDDQVYLLLAMVKLNDRHEAHTNMAEYELMLMRMWSEINGIYASNNIVLPLLGAGITRFDYGPKNDKTLLKCILCTLNSSEVNFDSELKIVLHEDKKDIPLYEYKYMFNKHI